MASGSTVELATLAPSTRLPSKAAHAGPAPCTPRACWDFGSKSRASGRSITQLAAAPVARHRYTCTPRASHAKAAALPEGASSAAGTRAAGDVAHAQPRAAANPSLTRLMPRR
jgi:hypothetical protein